MADPGAVSRVGVEPGVLTPPCCGRHWVACVFASLLFGLGAMMLSLYSRVPSPAFAWRERTCVAVGLPTGRRLRASPLHYR